MVFLWFRDTKKAKAMAIIMGALTAFLLILALILWGYDFYRRNTYDFVTATVTDSYASFNSQDRTNSQVWSDITFEHNGQTHTKRLSQWFRVDRELTILVNPKTPDQVLLESQVSGAKGLIALVGAGLFGAFFIVYLLIFMKNKNPRNH